MPTLEAVLLSLMGKHVKDIISQSHTHLLLWILHSIIHSISLPSDSISSGKLMYCYLSIMYTLTVSLLHLLAMWLTPPHQLSCSGTALPEKGDEEQYHSILLYLFTILTSWSSSERHFSSLTAVSRNLLESMMKVPWHTYTTHTVTHTHTHTHTHTYTHFSSSSSPV